MTNDVAKLAAAVDLAQNRLATGLKGVQGLVAHPVVEHISQLVDAQIALAIAKSGNAASIRTALRDLVEACEGEVEEIFSGEIGDQMRAARKALSGS